MGETPDGAWRKPITFQSLKKIKAGPKVAARVSETIEAVTKLIPHAPSPIQEEESSIICRSAYAKKCSILEENSKDFDQQ